MTFKESTLLKFPPFQALAQDIQTTLLQLVKEQRLNTYGGFKRTPNAWLIFRSNALALIGDKNIHQSEVSVQSKASWDNATTEQRAEMKARADAKAADLTKLFPDYHYRPFTHEETAQWKKLGIALRRTFWLASAVRIAKRIVDPDVEWEGFLSLSSWLRENVSPEVQLNIAYVHLRQ
jgi:hypothetical protein